MINSKQSYKEYLEEDRRALNRRQRFPMPWDYVWRFQRILRRCEYYTNCRKDPLGRAMKYYFLLRLHFFGAKCGFSIPANVFGKGLSIAHVGTIVVNPGARVGDYCWLHVGVNIGTAAGAENLAPQIGHRVYIGPGAKLFGGIRLADDIAIGANAVVNRDCLQPGVTLGGVPAKIISEKGSKGLLYSGE